MGRHEGESQQLPAGAALNRAELYELFKYGQVFCVAAFGEFLAMRFNSWLAAFLLFAFE